MSVRVPGATTPPDDSVSGGYDTRAGLHVDDILAKGLTSELEEFVRELDKKFGTRPAQWLTPSTPITFLAQRICMGFKDDGTKWYSMDQEANIMKFADANDVTPSVGGIPAFFH